MLFSQNPCILYSGNTKGCIFTHDTRSHLDRTLTELRMKGIVTSLQLTDNDIHLLASDALGNVCYQSKLSLVIQFNLSSISKKANPLKQTCYYNVFIDIHAAPVYVKGVRKKWF